jgi:hypothetical protein
MSSTDVRSETSILGPEAVPLDMQIEVVVVPVSDVDRAKQFYQSLGWHLDADYIGDGDFRVVQFTPPGSECSIIIGTGVTSATPGSVESLLLVAIRTAMAGSFKRCLETSRRTQSHNRPHEATQDRPRSNITSSTTMTNAQENRATAGAIGRVPRSSSPAHRASASPRL